MKWGFLLFLSCVMLQPSFAKDMHVHCQGQYNGEEFLNAELPLPELQKNLVIAEIESVHVILSSLSQEKIELQVYDENAPLRTYSTGVLKDHSDKIELSMWTRDYLLDVSCSLP